MGSLIPSRLRAKITASVPPTSPPTIVRPESTAVTSRVQYDLATVQEPHRELRAKSAPDQRGYQQHGRANQPDRGGAAPRRGRA